MRWVLDPEEWELQGQELAEREGIAPLPALMRVLTAQISKRDLPPELRTICDRAAELWLGWQPDAAHLAALKEEHAKVWAYLRRLAPPNGFLAGTYDGYYARALLFVLSVDGEYGAVNPEEDDVMMYALDWTRDFLEVGDEVYARTQAGGLEGGAE